MTLDRAELAGTGAALLLHVVLIAALSLSLAKVESPPEPPAMEVELVEEVGLAPAAPSPVPPAAQAPEPAQAPMIEPAPPPPRIEPVPEPIIAERPAAIAKPIARPPKRTVAAAKPSPAKTQPRKTKPAKAPAVKAPRVSRIGDDFLTGIAPASAVRPAAAAPLFNASAMAGIQQAIRRQIQPCADRQVDPGPGANRIRVTLNLRLTRSGELARQPEVVRTTGVDEENARFEDRVSDLAVAAYAGCAPLSGLPAELYQTAQGGWSNINMTYRLP